MTRPVILYDPDCPHRVGSLGWAMQNSTAVRIVVAIAVLEAGLLLGFLA